MAKNPMQKKATNAFLFGMIITLLIVALIGGIVYILVIRPQQEANRNATVQTTSREVYVIKQAVKSGEQLVVGLNVEKQKIETGLSTTDIVDPTGAKAKIDLAAGTIVTSSMLMADETLTSDVRLVEYNMITLPIDITIGDYIDIRITMPSGQDCIVVSKKPIVSMNGDTIGLNLSEEEILTMSSAIVEGYMMTASNIYAIKYVEPGTQDKATPTYPVNPDVKALIEANPNVVNAAKQAFKNRYSEGLRTYVNQELSRYQENGKENIEAGIAEQIEKAKEAREQYLSGLSAY